MVPFGFDDIVVDRITCTALRVSFNIDVGHSSPSLISLIENVQSEGSQQLYAHLSRRVRDYLVIVGISQDAGWGRCRGVARLLLWNRGGEIIELEVSDARRPEGLWDACSSAS